jgi:Rieske 2Fe-2S family protein
MTTAFVADSEDHLARMQQAVAVQMQDRDAGLMQYFYRSNVVYQRELETVFFKSWLWAGHVSQIPNPGDFFLYEIAEESVIVARGNDGEIRALINSCRHRGSRVCEERQGHCKTFVCPYHGWVYGTDGSLRAARHMDAMEGFRKEDLGLKQARVAVRFGMIFINFDPEAYDFNESLAQVDAQMAPYRLDRAKIAHRETYSVDANWKIALGNYLECYHCETAHRAYSKLHTFKEREEVVAPINRAMWERAVRETGVPDIEKAVYRMFREAPGFGACVYTSRYALFDGYLTGSRDGTPVAPLMGDFKGYDGGAGDYQLGPLTYMLNYPDHCILFRYVPFGRNRTDMEIVWFVDGDAVEGVDYDKAGLIWLWDVTTVEDKRIMQLNAAGVNSRFFEPGPQHPEFEDTPKRFVDWYTHALAGDFSVVPPTVRAHRTSSCEMTEHP